MDIMLEAYSDAEVDAAKVRYEELTRMILELSERRLKSAEILDSRSLPGVLWSCEVLEIKELKRRIKVHEDEGVRMRRANGEFETWYFTKDGVEEKVDS